MCEHLENNWKNYISFFWGKIAPKLAYINYFCFYGCPDLFLDDDMSGFFDVLETGELESVAKGLDNLRQIGKNSAQ